MNKEAISWLGAQADIGKPWDGPMVPDLTPPNKCWKKTAYSSEHEARRVIDRRMGSRYNRPKYLRAYHCPECNQWHLTGREDYNK